VSLEIRMIAAYASRERTTSYLSFRRSSDLHGVVLTPYAISLVSDIMRILLTISKDGGAQVLGRDMPSETKVVFPLSPELSLSKPAI